MLGKVLRRCYQIKLVLRPEMHSRLSAEKKKEKEKKVRLTAGAVFLRRPSNLAEASDGDVRRRRRLLPDRARSP